MSPSSQIITKWILLIIGITSAVVLSILLARWIKGKNDTPACSPSQASFNSDSNFGARMNKGISRTEQNSNNSMAYSSYSSLPGAYTNVVSGQEYAQQNMAGHQQYIPNDPRYQSQPACGMVATSGCGVAAKQSCSTGPEPASFYPYSGGQGAAAFDSAYPNEEDMSSLYPRGCPSSQQAGYEMNVNSLLPAAFRNNTQCSDAAVDGSQWTKYAPTREAFDRYITAQGSARLSLTTRSPLGRIVGIPDLLRQSPPMPLSSENIVFNDSSFRQDLVYKQMGRYPESVNC